jgi:hypothetical protein
MDRNERRDERQTMKADDASRRRDRDRDRDRSTGSDEAEAPGSTILDASPSMRAAKGTSDNPVRRLSRDAGDMLADEVREGWADARSEERDRERGR